MLYCKIYCVKVKAVDLFLCEEKCSEKKRALQPLCKCSATVEDIFIRRTEMHCVKGLHSPNVKCTVGRGGSYQKANNLGELIRHSSNAHLLLCKYHANVP
jgi:hypothetical protein